MHALGIVELCTELFKPVYLTDFVFPHLLAVAPYAPGMQQPSSPGPQGQGQLSGRKRAVLCGCNYRGSSAQLNGKPALE